MSRFLRLFILVTSMLVITACLANSCFGPTPTPVPNPVLPPVTLAVQAQPNTYTTVNQVINYTYQVSNTGTSPLAGPVAIQDDKKIVSCPNVNTIGNKDGNLDVSDGSITCTGSYIITQADVSAGKVTSTATATIAGQSSSPISTTIQVPLNPVLTLSITPSPNIYNLAGQNITYTYVITNTGAGTLGPAQFIVSDSLFPNPINCGANTTTLATNQNVNCQAIYTTTAADAGAPQIVSTATASGAGAGTIQSATATVIRSNVTLTPSINITPGVSITHIVTPGDWLLQISRCYGASFPAVRTANPQVIDPDLIYPNTVVKIPNAGSNGRIYGPPCMLYYTAVAGDTWQSIADKYNADVDVLRAANINVTLAAGVKVKVPVNSKGGAPVTPVPTTPVPIILRLTVTANPNTFTAAGQNITLSYTIANAGTTTLGPAQFIIRDSLFPNPINCGSNTTTLAPNLSVSCNIVYITTQTDVNAGQFVSNATASGGNAATPQSTVTTVRYAPIVPTVPTARQPIRLAFPPTNPATVTQSGTIGTPDTIRYIFTGTAGQILSIRLIVPTNDVNMGVYGPNNVVLKQPDLINSWSGTLTANGDHFIDLVSSTGGPSKSYTLEVTLTTPAPPSPIERVADISPGGGSSNPSHLSVFNGQLYFQANAGNDNAGAELWRYAGTGNPVRAADINPGSTGSEPSFLRPYKDHLYFRANGDQAGAELWRLNAAGAWGRAFDLFVGGDSNPMYMTVFNDFLYFSANGNDGAGIELWRYDGVTAPTRVADINQGPGNSNPSYLAVYNNLLYFSATTTNGGTELWKFDGTTASLAVDLTTGAGNSNPAFLAVYNNLLYFSANGGDNAGTELWRYDGINPPTRTADINPGPADSAPTYLTVFNNALYFGAVGDSAGFELWKFDGTTATRVADINPAGNSSPAYLAVFNNELYFQANSNDGTGTELWKFKGP